MAEVMQFAQTGLGSAEEPISASGGRNPLQSENPLETRLS